MWRPRRRWGTGAAGPTRSLGGKPPKSRANPGFPTGHAPCPPAEWGEVTRAQDALARDRPEGTVREYVVVVDHANHALGAVEKLRAHRQPVLHRAVSVLLFHPAGALLMQRRAAHKYHSALRWSNTCCGHPLPGESSRRAAARRLQAEMGITAPLQPAGQLAYRLDVGDGLHEHELNQVFVGEYSGAPEPSPDEVAEWHWLTASVARSLCRDNQHVTAWLPMVLEAVTGWATTADALPPGLAAWNRAWAAAA